MRRPTHPTHPSVSPSAPEAPRRLARPAALALAAGAVMLAGLAAGCEDDVTAAERQVRSAVGEASTTVSTNPAEAVKTLTPAAGLQDAPGASRAQANDLLATAEYRQATALTGQAAGLQLEAVGLGADLDRLAQQVALSNALAAGYARLDPNTPAAEGQTAPLAALDARVKKVQSGDTWSPDGASGVTLPTLQAVRAEVERLKGQVADKEAQSANLDQQRTELLKRADALSLQSEGSTGQQSVDSYKRASDLRKQAGDLATEREVVDGAADPLRADLTLGEAREAQLAAAVDNLQSQRKITLDGWSVVQTQIAGLQSLARTLLAGDGTVTPPSTGDDAPPATSVDLRSAAEKAARLNEVLGQTEPLVDQATQLLASSAGHAEAAAKAAEQYGTELSAQTASLSNAGDSPLTKLRETLDPAAYRLRQALAQLERGRLLGARAASTATLRTAVRALGAAAQQGGFDAVADLPSADGLGERLQAAVAGADEAYEAALAQLENLSTNRSKPLADAAKEVKVFALYGQALLARTQQASGVGDVGDRRVEDRLNAAAAAAKEAQEAGLKLALPSELAERAPAPAATPADDQSAAPAEGQSASPAEGATAPPAAGAADPFDQPATLSGDAAGDGNK